MKKSIIFTLYFLGIQLITGGLMSLLVKYGVIGNTTMLILATATSSVLTIVLFLWLKYSAVSPNYLRSKPWMTLIFCVLASIGTIIPSTWLQEIMPELPNYVEAELGTLIKSSYGFFIIGLLAPFAEELVFRGAILRTLLGWSKNHWTAIVLSAVFFAIAHFNPAQLPHTFLIGILLGWMYYRTGSIIPCIALHWTNNIIAYIAYNILPNPEAPLKVLLGSQQNVTMAVVYSLFILLPSIFMLNKLMKQN